MRSLWPAGFGCLRPGAVPPRPPAPRARREVKCAYLHRWIPMGRARTRCPECGAVVGTDAHPIRTVKEKNR